MKPESGMPGCKAGATILLLACGLSAGCAPTEMVGAWRSPSFHGPSFKRVLVVDMAKRADVRRMYEDAFVQALGTAGATGLASYPLLTEAQMSDKAAIAAAVARSGADAVLVTRLVKVVKQEVVIPPRPSIQEYVDTAWPGTYTPTVAGENEIVTLRTRLFGAATQQPVWSGTTQTFDAQNLKQATSSVSRIIVKQLARQKLI
jgi:hypothetical protein